MNAPPVIIEYFALAGLAGCLMVLVGACLCRLPKRARAFSRKFGPIGVLVACLSVFGAVTNSFPTEDEKDEVQSGLDGDAQTNALCGAMLMAAPRRTLPPPAPSTLDLEPYRLVLVTTNENYSYVMPSNALCYAPWTLRGAAEDWTRIEVGRMMEEGGCEEWRFPMGTNYYSAFQVFTDGTIRPKLHSLSNEVVAVGASMSAVPDVSRFWYTVGTNDSRVLTWENFFLGRVLVEAGGGIIDPALPTITNCPTVNAQIELFRSGDYIVRSNGVERLYRFVDPFDIPEEEWGQSDVDRAYIDEMVGTNLENGYYKLTVTVPPSVGRRTLITVGDRQLVADRPGEYAFLLEKGEEYELSLLPFSPDIIYDAVDDIRPLPLMMMGTMGMSLGVWTKDCGWHRIVSPTEFLPGWCYWIPKFTGSPNVSFIGPGDSTEFMAVFDDCPHYRTATYEWTSEDENIHIESPHAERTRVLFYDMPSWRSSSLRVVATIGTNTLESVLNFNYGRNSEPQVHPVLITPNVVVKDGKRRKLQVEFSSDREVDDGSLRLTCTQGRDRISLWSAESGGTPVAFEKSWSCRSFGGFECYIAGMNASESVDDVVFSLTYIPESGGDSTMESGSVTVVDFVSEPISSYENTFASDRPYMNPCAIRSGRPETFWAILLPADAPLSWLTWHAKSGEATFPNGNVGRRVEVDASSSGLILEARIHGYDDEPDPIEFKVDVIQEEN